MAAAAMLSDEANRSAPRIMASVDMSRANDLADKLLAIARLPGTDPTKKPLPADRSDSAVMLVATLLRNYHHMPPQSQTRERLGSPAGMRPMGQTTRCTTPLSTCCRRTAAVTK